MSAREHGRPDAHSTVGSNTKWHWASAHQKISFIDACRIRGSFAPVIRPNALDEMLAFGSMKFGWFIRLNDSARACSVSRSYKVNSRVRARSTLKYPGPRKLA